MSTAKFFAFACLLACVVAADKYLLVATFSGSYDFNGHHQCAVSGNTTVDFTSNSSIIVKGGPHSQFGPGGLCDAKLLNMKLDTVPTPKGYYMFEAHAGACNKGKNPHQVLLKPGDKEVVLCTGDFIIVGYDTYATWKVALKAIN
eukprot:NODE_9269_length_652_cov_139.317580_g9003_i0.p2 GENE.NODE_9269_length_652_cov_139.317580_g9003_i0~~NODE_9269_length_652_cov_139.317580_g9003_i0.p2  ORF type:complete len:162 (-),score=62.48 NODE_9269_length_652_cov_139.317580_g9003_i0:167-601(-)